MKSRRFRGHPYDFLGALPQGAGNWFFWGSDVIDWSRVYELYDEVGEESLGEVLELFASEVEEGLARLAQADSPKAISAEFHFLKGAALNLGLDEVARLCQQGEAGALAGASTQAEREAITEKFPACCAELCATWRDRIASR